MGSWVERRPGVLGNSEFRALWIAEAQSVAGDQLAKVAITLVVYARTHSALWAALAYALTFLPALIGGLGFAQLADRYPRRAVLVVSTSVQAVFIGGMAVPGMPLTAMCALLFAAGIAQAPALAAQNAITREILAVDTVYYRSQDLRAVTTNTVMLVGLAAAGVLVTLLGTSTTLAIDALTFALSSLLVGFGVRCRRAAAGATAARSAGLRYVLHTPWLRTLLGLSWLVGLAVVPEGLAAPLAAELGASPRAVGWLLAADPLGYVVGVFLLSRLVSIATRQRLVGLFAVASPAVLLLFVFTPELWSALAVLALAGACGAYQVTVGATLTSWVPNEVRGGVLGIGRTGLRVSQGLGVAAGGAIGQLLGSASYAIVAAAALGVLLALPLVAGWVRHSRSTLVAAARA
ncbi:MAG: MFS transporter [Sciscionella sp.]